MLPSHRPQQCLGSLLWTDQLWPLIGQTLALMRSTRSLSSSNVSYICCRIPDSCKHCKICKGYGFFYSISLRDWVCILPQTVKLFQPFPLYCGYICPTKIYTPEFHCIRQLSYTWIVLSYGKAHRFSKQAKLKTILPKRWKWGENSKGILPCDIWYCPFHSCPDSYGWLQYTNF